MSSWKRYKWIDPLDGAVRRVHYYSVDEHPTAECAEFPDCTGFYVWRGACYALCNLLTCHKSIVSDKRVIEFGSGIGLPSAVAAHQGASFVLATDAQPPLLAYADANIKVNLHERDGKVAPNCSVTPREDDRLLEFAAKLTWENATDIDAILTAMKGERFQVGLASDVLWLRSYNSESIYEQCVSLLRTASYLLTEDGLLLMTYQTRMDGMTADIFAASETAGFAACLVEVPLSNGHVTPPTSPEVGATSDEDPTPKRSGVLLVVMSKDKSCLQPFLDSCGLHGQFEVCEESSWHSRYRDAPATEAADAMGIAGTQYANPLFAKHQTKKT